LRRRQAEHNFALENKNKTNTNTNINSLKTYKAMKKLFLALAAFALIIPAAVSAQNTVTKTHFEGRRITGVSASSSFEVVLVKSDRTKAVVEVSRDFESYVDISHDGDGIVTVGLRDMGSHGWRGFNRLSDRDRVLRLTLYLPTVNTIRLSSSASLSSADSFGGDNLDIHTSSSSTIREGLQMSYQRVKLQCSSSSTVNNLILDGRTTDLAVVLSSSSRATIIAPTVAYSKLGVSSSARLSIRGAGDSADMSAGSGALIDAEEFFVKKLLLSASSGATASAGVAGAAAELTATLSSSARATIRARGVGESKFTVTSGGLLTVYGDGYRGDWTAASSGRIVAEEFALKDLNVTASSGASIRANVSGTLTTRTSSGAAVRYTGNPARVNDLSSGVRPL
jgi:hypothetical protein